MPEYTVIGHQREGTYTSTTSLTRMLCRAAHAFTTFDFPKAYETKLKNHPHDNSNAFSAMQRVPLLPLITGYGYHLW